MTIPDWTCDPLEQSVGRDEKCSGDHKVHVSAIDCLRALLLCCPLPTWKFKVAAPFRFACSDPRSPTDRSLHPLCFKLTFDRAAVDLHCLPLFFFEKNIHTFRLDIKLFSNSATANTWFTNAVTGSVSGCRISKGLNRTGGAITCSPSGASHKKNPIISISQCNSSSTTSNTAIQNCNCG